MGVAKRVLTRAVEDYGRLLYGNRSLDRRIDPQINQQLLPRLPALALKIQPALLPPILKIAIRGGSGPLLRFATLNVNSITKLIQLQTRGKPAHVIRKKIPPPRRVQPPADWLPDSKGTMTHYERFNAAVDRKERELPTEQEPLRHVERILLNAVLANPETRSGILPRLKNVPEIQQFVTLKIFQALFAIEESGAPLRIAEVQARLDAKDQELLSALLFADKTEEDEYSLEHAEACLRTLEQSGRDAQRAALKGRIKEAERAGMLEEALRIAQELSRLERA